MLISCWSAKGGSGTTVVAAALAVLLARQDTEVLLVDTAGDLPAVLGLPEPDGPGLSGWLDAGRPVPPEGLGRLEVPVDARVSLLPSGRLPLAHPQRAEVLAGLLAGERRTVVVDAGLIGPAGGTPDDDLEVRRTLAASAVRSLLVLRPCYLSLRRAMASALRPSGVVLVAEPGRSLDADDVSNILDVPVVAEVPVEPAVARAVDAGLLAARVPRSLDRALRGAA